MQRRARVWRALEWISLTIGAAAALLAVLVLASIHYQFFTGG
jgi:hypothetical protein